MVSVNRTALRCVRAFRSRPETLEMSLEHSPAKGRNYQRAEASVYLKDNYGLSYTPATLAKLACLGVGPLYHAGSRYPLYPQAALDEWALKKLGPLVRSSSEATAAVAA
jgi:hypothetical protein